MTLPYHSSASNQSMQSRTAYNRDACTLRFRAAPFAVAKHGIRLSALQMMNGLRMKLHHLFAGKMDGNRDHHVKQIRQT
jgi:hypothetical protein